MNLEVQHGASRRKEQRFYDGLMDYQSFIVLFVFSTYRSIGCSHSIFFDFSASVEDSVN